MTSIIFYEENEAKKLLSSGDIDFITFHQLFLLAKYFKHIGKNNSQTKKSLIEFSKKHNKDFNEILARNAIENAIKKSQKYTLRDCKGVIVTEAEMENIRKAEGYKKQKTLFTMLVLAKFFKHNDNRVAPKPSKYDSGYFSNATLINIFALAKINVSKKERNTMQYELERDGFIRTVRSNSFEIFFADENSKEYLLVDDLDNLIAFYPFYCEKCGKQVEKKAKRHNMCEECYVEYRRTTIKESTRKYRQSL